VVFLIIWETNADPRAIGLIVAAIIGAIGVYYLWLSSHLDAVPDPMRTYPWARSERGLRGGGIVIIGAAVAIAVVGFLVQVPE
jgi:hypothetical protein